MTENIFSLFVEKKGGQEPHPQEPAKVQEEKVGGDCDIAAETKLAAYIYYIFLIIVLIFVVGEASTPADQESFTSKMNPFNYI